ncbi:RagB/SusD family nutrient uptake outer membrane protein [Flavobacterium gawalongense]|uniref:RagB/SusD family nutrient uptake outer membrane protein n=1 Tax=Flavobacterium gawalongense TaxID=2594432 RepID=A0ABY3CNU5_9FLAO|nr:RagB/SusD family nutrient uptake outer membrane protein [Flavobacterium gawalongense]TRX03715.1 RagB/SusD family nutrient uptake outer membrane protein [Flavobacterium gawalongense]TRX08862.1 RagB/SusD family nutrient uptake outer membrane protein [Flavobacterium gawalongense]
MKKILNYIVLGGLFLGLSGCQDEFVDLNPIGQISDVNYFKKPSDFKAYTTGFYGQLQGWDFGNMDNGSDLSANANGNGMALGQGTITAGGGNWNYSGIRSCNILLAKANEYSGAGSISQYVGEAHFFRAHAYFNLLKTFGGVPLVTTVLYTDSPELYGPRNSRYEVVAQILSDLDKAISNLPTEQNLVGADKGRISKWAAMALKAQTELYEATWEKYVGKDADGDGAAIGGGAAGYNAANVNIYLADAAAMCKEIMDNGGYELWNKNADSKMANLSSWYLFNLEDAGSNPGGYDKSTNKEFILYSVYDYTLRQSGKNISWTSWQLYPSRKFVDMAVCTDGLPATASPLFQGYKTTTSEFQARDLRLLNYLYSATTAPTSVTLDFGSLGSSGYGNSKYAVEGLGVRRKDNTESANWPIIRLAEVYLTYAEALYELNGSITDAQLNASINKLRDRAKVAYLTNALASANGLDMKQEIRRERAVELYREGKRFDDLKRWGILEASLNPSRLGRVVGSASYTTPFKDASGNPTAAYKANTYVFGEEAVVTPKGALNCVVIDSKLNHSVAKKHYLFPIPQSQMVLNNKLLQNPGY